jgi:hypothetical protein
MPRQDPSRTLLTTVTGEPFQPVRLYYTVANKTLTAKALARLRCIDEDKREKSWVWLYRDEAESLTFGRPHAELPAHVHPLLIGRFQFPEKTRMVLELRSAERATLAAKFFAPILGSGVVLTRLRVINRWFDVEEVTAGLDRLDQLLDTNVVRISSEDGESELERELESRRKDVPLVEDFPLHVEEETPDFQDLRMLLQLRTVRAHEHWKGNTEVTLMEVVKRVVQLMEPM